MRKLRAFFESLVYTGLKPVDPLYLSNRTWKQKAASASLVAAPCVVVVLVLGLVFGGYLQRKPTPFPVEPPNPAPKKVAAVETGPPVLSTLDLEVLDAHVVHENGTRVAGRIKNNTDRAIVDIDLAMDLADSHGSRMGAVSTRINFVAPRSTAAFEFPVAQQAAASAVVREIHGR